MDGTIRSVGRTGVQFWLIFSGLGNHVAGWLGCWLEGVVLGVLGERDPAVGVRLEAQRLAQLVALAGDVVVVEQEEEEAHEDEEDPEERERRLEAAKKAAREKKKAERIKAREAAKSGQVQDSSR